MSRKKKSKAKNKTKKKSKSQINIINESHPAERVEKLLAKTPRKEWRLYEISEKIGISRGSTANALKQLYLRNIVSKNRKGLGNVYKFVPKKIRDELAIYRRENGFSRTALS